MRATSQILLLASILLLSLSNVLAAEVGKIDPSRQGPAGKRNFIPGNLRPYTPPPKTARYNRVVRQRRDLPESDPQPVQVQKKRESTKPSKRSWSPAYNAKEEEKLLEERQPLSLEKVFAIRRQKALIEERKAKKSRKSKAVKTASQSVSLSMSSVSMAPASSSSETRPSPAQVTEKVPVSSVSTEKKMVRRYRV